MHKEILKIEEIDEGIDFFFKSKLSAVKLVEFL
jgi:hypothetical protein